MVIRTLKLASSWPRYVSDRTDNLVDNSLPRACGWPKRFAHDVIAEMHAHHFA